MTQKNIIRLKLTYWNENKSRPSDVQLSVKYAVIGADNGLSPVNVYVPGE